MSTAEYNKTAVDYKKYPLHRNRRTLVCHDPARGYRAELTLDVVSSSQLELSRFIIHEDDPDHLRTIAWKQSLLILMARTVIGLFITEHSYWWQRLPVKDRIDVIGPHLPYVDRIYTSLDTDHLYVFLYEPKSWHTKYSSRIRLDANYIRQECVRSLNRLKAVGTKYATSDYCLTDETA